MRTPALAPINGSQALYKKNYDSVLFKMSAPHIVTAARAHYVFLTHSVYKKIAKVIILRNVTITNLKKMEIKETKTTTKSKTLNADRRNAPSCRIQP